MSIAGYRYDNSTSMELYLNKLKNECFKMHEFKKEKQLYQAAEEFAYVHYNYVCPCQYNEYRALFKVCIA